MSSYNELVTILKELLTNRFYPKPNYIKGLLGDGNGNVLVPGRPDYNYVRFNRSSSEKFEAFNKEVSQPVDGLPVLLGELPWMPGIIQVVGVDWSTYLQTGWGDTYAGIAAHAPTHEWPNFAPGSDPLNTYIRAVVPMRTQTAGSGSTAVFVTAYEYDWATGTNINWPGVPAKELSPATPPTGSMRYMGVYLNPATNTLGVVTGATTVYTDAIEPARPTWPRNVFPSGYVRLYGGQAGITERDIRDARRLWDTTTTVTGSSGGGVGAHNLLSADHPDTLPASVQAGDLIYGNSTPKWARLPVITGSFLGSGAGTPAWVPLPSTFPTGPAGGDLTGTYPNPRVVGLNSIPMLGTPSEGQVLMFTGSAWRPQHLGGISDNRIRQIGVTVENPTNAESIPLLYVFENITVVELQAVVIGSGSPSVTINPVFDSSVAGAGTAILSSATAITNTTTGQNLTSFNDATIPADNFIILKTTAQSGTVTKLHLTIKYTLD